VGPVARKTAAGSLEHLPVARVPNVVRALDNPIKTSGGLVILHGFVQESPLSWKDGQIYDPDSGKTYKAIIRLKENDLNHLSLKGYVGIPLFGRASEWTRASQ